MPRLSTTTTRVLRICGGLFVTVLAAGVLLVSLLVARAPVPDLEALRAGESPLLGQATRIYTADGVELARWFDEDRVWVRHSEIAPVVYDALIAVEDHRFYTHRGVDFRRLAGALYHTLRGQRQGGSTLAMQLSRNLYPAIAAAPLWKRKGQEMITALALERTYSKPEILELYLNTVPFGHRAYGVEAASRVFFDESAATVSTLQAATLIAVLRGPSYYNPRQHPERTRARRALVLDRMVATGRLDVAERPSPRAPLYLAPPRDRSTTALAPHFLDRVRAEVATWAAAQGLDPARAGLRVYTTLDASLQQMAVRAVTDETERIQAIADAQWAAASPEAPAQEAPLVERRPDAFQFWWDAHPDRVRTYVRRTAAFQTLRARGYPPAAAQAQLLHDQAFTDSLRLAQTRMDAGFVALDPRTGAIRAYVGGRDHTIDAFDKAGQARRQSGSTFKPFLYAAAMEAGYSPFELVKDSVVTYRQPNGTTWRPRNAGGGASHQALTLREALAHSTNTVAAHLGMALGPAAVADAARRAGLQTPQRPVPSLALGTSEVTLLELTAAYGTLANEGRAPEPRLIARIEQSSGTVVATFGPAAQDGLSRYAAYLTLDMLRDVVSYGTGSALRTTYGLQGDLAGKTGTTQHGADGWFMMLHPALAMGAWVGFNDPQVRLRTSSSAQGSRTALPIVATFAQTLFEANPALEHARFRAPEGHHMPRPSFLDPDDQPSRRAVNAHLFQPALDSTLRARLERLPLPPAWRQHLFSVPEDRPAEESWASQDMESILRARIDGPDHERPLVRRDTLATGAPPDAERALRLRLPE